MPNKNSSTKKVVVNRAQQKERTRRALIDAALGQMSADQSFAGLSLREVAREAGIAPTSFYRHFRDMDELGLCLVDEGGLTLRQLMRKARQRIAQGSGAVIVVSVATFMEFIDAHENVFRLLLRERSGTSREFRAAVAREFDHFVAELAEYIIRTQTRPIDIAYLQAETMVTLVFNGGAEALDLPMAQRQMVEQKIIKQLRLVALGAKYLR